ncbi:MAG TPA: alpha/beta fold hydrolase [Streptosporangiaceae bacterium]|jgi:thioesterase domain-containing protein/peptidoglycan/xylan/chitin deacetylase (PgdA/CDA1 family)|nr:alpha/beta fold hydrolase [Streptosporangiaceae bacterium]
MNGEAPRLLCGTPELPPNSVALTFDDGPGPRSAELARLLRDEGVPGTFFVLGESLERHGHVLDTYRECGHVIGLHGDRHRPFRSAARAAVELGRCAKRISGYLGDGYSSDKVWFRPPYGMGDWPVPGFAGPVGWHAQGRDWDITYRHGQTVDGCVQAITEQIVERRGGIVLLHDFAASSEFVPAGLTEADLDLRIIEITTLLIQRLRGAGFVFTGLPEPVPAAAPERPAADCPAGTGGAARTSMSEDLQSLRLHRKTAKASGGILDVVMPIRGGDGPPLFCAHPVVGLSWCYLALLPYVDARFPLYGLQARGLKPSEPLPASLAEMARDYVDEIRMTQPSGPYHLLGWSLGGNVAYAIAEEIERRGEQVGLLVILDSSFENSIDGVRLEGEPWTLYNLVLAQFGYVPALTPADPDPEARMLDLVRRRPGLGLDEWPDQRLHALQRVIKNSVALARAQQPSPVNCPLLFVSATRNPPGLDRKLDVWRPLIGGPIEGIEVDCDHRYMLLPEPMARIGPALTDALTRAASVRQVTR